MAINLRGFLNAFQTPSNIQAVLNKQKSLKYNYREKTQQFLPITLSSLCRIHLGKPMAKDRTVGDPIVSKGQK